MEQELKKQWKRFVGDLLDAREAWGEIQELRASMPSIEGLEVSWQEVMTKVPWQSKFEIALDALMAYWQVYGGMEILVPPEEKKVTKTKEKEKV